MVRLIISFAIIMILGASTNLWQAQPAGDPIDPPAPLNEAQQNDHPQEDVNEWAETDPFVPHITRDQNLSFEVLDIYIDSGATPLAAYQVQISAAGDQTRIIGIEGGEHPAFAHPPYYDSNAYNEAQLNERIIIADFTLDNDLPSGRMRIARIHVALWGQTEYTIELQAAGDADGHRIEATVEMLPVE